MIFELHAAERDVKPEITYTDACRAGSYPIFITRCTEIDCVQIKVHFSTLMSMSIGNGRSKPIVSINCTFCLASV